MIGNTRLDFEKSKGERNKTIGCSPRPKSSAYGGQRELNSKNHDPKEDSAITER